MSFDFNNLVNKVLDPQAMLVWVPLVLAALKIHVPGFTGKQGGRNDAG